jgi:hypothetical protein
VHKKLNVPAIIISNPTRGSDVYLRFSVFVLSCIVFLVSLGGVRLSPLGTSDINWPIVPAPDDRR